jgi:hypothetical protein
MQADFLFDECPVEHTDYLNFLMENGGLDKLKTKYSIRPELEIFDSIEFLDFSKHEIFPESKEKAIWRTIKIHERMLKKVTN